MPSLHRKHTIDLLFKSMVWILFNDNNGLKWQRECMIKVNVNFYIFLIVSSSKKNVKQRLGRWEQTTFQTGRIQSCCYLAPNKKWLIDYLWKFRSSHPEVFLRKGAAKICSRFTEEHQCRSVISIKLLCNFALRHGWSPASLLHIFRTTFPRNTSGWLLLEITWIFLV